MQGDAHCQSVLSNCSYYVEKKHVLLLILNYFLVTVVIIMRLTRSNGTRCRGCLELGITVVGDSRDVGGAGGTCSEWGMNGEEGKLVWKIELIYKKNAIMISFLLELRFSHHNNLSRGRLFEIIKYPLVALQFMTVCSLLGRAAYCSMVDKRKVVNNSRCRHMKAERQHCWQSQSILPLSICTRVPTWISCTVFSFI